jgi:hypothetical protein
MTSLLHRNEPAGKRYGIADLTWIELDQATAGAPERFIWADPALPAEQPHAHRTAAPRAFSLTFPITERDAVDRRGPTPTVDSARRDWSGERRQGEVPSMMRTNGLAAAG